MLKKFSNNFTGAGKLLEFGVISGAIGLAGDLATPVGPYIYWMLAAGVVLLISAYPLARRLGWESDLTKSSAVFGAVLTCLGLWSTTGGSPEGRIASGSEFMAHVQQKLLSMEESVKQIADNTRETADNTARTAESTSKTADNTERLAENIFDMSALETAIEYRDFRKMTGACADGQKKDGFDVITPGRYDKVKEDSIYQHLRKAGCIDTTIICTTDMDSVLAVAKERGYDPDWLYPIRGADLGRVTAICGADVASAYTSRKEQFEDQRNREIAAKTAAREKAEAELEATVSECEKEIGDRNWCRLAVEAKIYPRS
ncbi:hypothetical protein NBH19_18190 [Rhizobium sp. S95]|uniref:Uncharacterized protein n=1 Tax=Ciceribacter sichuanensis TaxID=2949647 RepID=A0AAJ1C1R0_9HYPH|nr:MULTISPECIES: hypothetical protein [unclassified Ciceribacter]MCM2398001.1 hypothetical protein [Ciceribacter sp. S95]MCO5959193.1 hypothetical protein [Ciceribacter sp. S101]